MIYTIQEAATCSLKSAVPIHRGFTTDLTIFVFVTMFGEHLPSQQEERLLLDLVSQSVY